MFLSQAPEEQKCNREVDIQFVKQKNVISKTLSSHSRADTY